VSPNGEAEVQTAGAPSVLVMKVVHSSNSAAMLAPAHPARSVPSGSAWQWCTVWLATSCPSRAAREKVSAKPASQLAPAELMKKVRRTPAAARSA